MKKTVCAALCAAFVLGLSGLPVHAASVRVALPDFDVTLNGVRIENAARQYPLLVYRGITYFPLTYDDCRFLGLESDYTAQNGLAVDKTGVIGSYNDYKLSGKNPRRATAQTAAFPICVNGKTVDNGKEEYPLLLYRDICYFPLTWRFAVEEFGWEYEFDSARGLAIRSAPPALPSAEEIAALVGEAAARLRDGEWLRATFRAFSRYENRVHAIVSEHRPSGALWYRTVEMTEADAENGNDNTANPHVTGHYLERDGAFYSSDDGKKWTRLSGADPAFDGSADRKLSGVTAALERLPPMGFENAWTSMDQGYPCLAIGFEAEEPSYLPQRDKDGLVAGGIERHEFFFDLRERCLRSYRTTTLPLGFGDDGALFVIAPSTVFYDVTDLDYRPVTFPAP
jgi:hypothetical protein